MTTELNSPGPAEPTRTNVRTVRSTWWSLFTAGHVQGDVRYRVLSVRAIVAWAVLIVLVGAGVAVWLLLAYTGGDADANRVQLDAIRTAGTIVVGTGGAAALLLAARRQRTAEIALRQKDRDQADAARTHAHQVEVAEQNRRHQERVATATEADAVARRITDLYTKAADQLGSDKAPVRLAGLYALERLAQDHTDQRQTIVNVLCAYLRMPNTLPGQPPDTDDTGHARHQERVQEREVRLTAQRILTRHLHTRQSDETFWTDLDLDLTGATLINLDLSYCSLRTATFDQAKFIGGAVFEGAQFTGDASFSGAQFGATSSFHGAQFTGGVGFSGIQFCRSVSFRKAQFGDDAMFSGTKFIGDAVFMEAQFNGGASFHGVQVTSEASFQGAQFCRRVSFRKAQFAGAAAFEGAQFRDDAVFSEAQFAGSVPPEVAPLLPPAGAEQQENDESSNG